MLLEPSIERFGAVTYDTPQSGIEPGALSQNGGACPVCFIKRGKILA